MNDSILKYIAVASVSLALCEFPPCSPPFFVSTAGAAYTNDVAGRLLTAACGNGQQILLPYDDAENITCPSWPGTGFPFSPCCSS